MSPATPSPSRKVALAAVAVLIAFVIVAGLRMRAPKEGSRGEPATPAPTASVASVPKAAPETEVESPQPVTGSPARKVLAMIESRDVNGRDFDVALATLTAADAGPLAVRYWKTPAAHYEQRAALVLALSKTRTPEARKALVDVVTADLSGRDDLSSPELERYDVGERDQFISSMLLPETLALRRLAAEARSEASARGEVIAAIRKALAQRPPGPLLRRLEEELRSLERAQ